MINDTAFIVISATVAGLLGIAATVAVLQERAARQVNGGSQDEGDGGALTAADKYGPSGNPPGSRTGYDGVLRVVWWLSIVAVLVGVGLSKAYPATETQIFGVGGAAAALVVLLHEILPARRRGALASTIEVVGALALISGLVLLTGEATSPFVFFYHVVAVAVALTVGGWAAMAVAAVASLAYLGISWLDPLRATFGGVDLLRIGLNAGSIFVLAYLAGVFASGERRLRGTIERLWRIDHMTGLIRREELSVTLEQEVQRSRRSERSFCLLMCDLDGLKTINDTSGHERGDAVLRGVGSAIRRSIRTVDSAYRYGGDEFVVLLPETEYRGAYLVAEKIRIGVEELGLAAPAADMVTSISIGLVSYPEDGISAEELLLAADRAMYHAKGLGKNQISGNPRPPRRLAMAIEAPRPDRPREPSPRPQPVDFGGASHEPAEEDEPDPREMRRQIAAAQRNMDPDHQIRKAMDVFLS
ncbi:MAG TPA: diguanylate cyclase [Candidatus Saccharimonadales bacterium]|nr:diguanylate cyclase [Candidatus Saccharimonadales bacterium]